jgi:predicted nucleic acid-binding protein
VPVFVDTNVLVYARDIAEPMKQARASEWVRALWESDQGRLSIQVLEEFYVTTTRKLRPGLSPQAARADVEDLLAWRPVVLDAAVVKVGWTIEDRFGLSFWDSLVVGAAHVGRCDVLLTEDLPHGAEFDGVRVADPFRTSVGEVL